MVSLNASKPQKVNLNDLPKVLESLMSEKNAETFIGALPSSQGLFILIFSHKLNEEFSILVTGADHSRILSKVHEVLATERGRA